uniref:Putative secreted protein n=1 Tax=Anopheles darlingi TaxID=43151 RepID=A0A2M4D1E7_ANODA
MELSVTGSSARLLLLLLLGAVFFVLLSSSSDSESTSDRSEDELLAELVDDWPVRDGFFNPVLSCRRIGSKGLKLERNAGIILRDKWLN